MVSFKSLTLAATLLGYVTLAAENRARKVPGAYIVEFHDDHETESFYTTLSNAGHVVEPRLELKYDLFKGVSFTLKETEDEESAAQKILALPEVRKIWPVRSYSMPKHDVAWTGNEGTASLTSGVLKRQDNGNDTFAPHVMIQVDQLHARGFRGAGIKIAIVDTGVDYKHPALGGCFGEEKCLVSFGADLVGDDYDGDNTPVPDADPYDCDGHGTHVAGIIAAQPNTLGFTGAAPDAKLGMYRVFGCYGSASDDILIAAYNQAYQDGAHIITCSINAASGWAENPWSAAVTRIVEAGVPCLSASGNDGDAGQFYSGSSGDGKGVTSVASVDSTQSPSILLGNSTFTVNNGTRRPFGWLAGTPGAWGNITLPLWSVNYDTADPFTACATLPDDTPDLSGYIVLARRGNCTFAEKAAFLVAKGAKYLMFYNDADGVDGPYAVIGTDDVSAVGQVTASGMTTAAQGAEWVGYLASGSTVTLSMVDPAVAVQLADLSSPNTIAPGFVSYFTSWGPDYEVDVKNQFSAPGGLILSTYPVDLGGYAVLSGTSMSCPLAAAVYALVSQVRGTRDPATLESVLSATANPNLFNTGALNRTFPYLAPVSQQGGGLIQALDAAYTTTLLSVSSLSFNDTDHFAGTQNFTIRNLGTNEVTFTLSHVPAGTFYTFDAGGVNAEFFPNTYDSAVANLDFSSKSISVPAGGSSDVTIIADAPVGLDTHRLPVYSGYIALNSTDGQQSLSLPYLGVAGSLYSAAILTNESYLTTDTDVNNEPVVANTSFVVNLNQTYTIDESLPQPQMIVDMLFGTPIVSIKAWAVQGGNATNATQSLGNIEGFPLEWASRGLFYQTWQGVLADGSRVPEGKYQLELTALRVFGDREVARDYDRIVSVPFSISFA